MKKFLGFFNDLISASSDSSSKRFAALFTLLNVLILAYLAAWKSGWICPQSMFDSLCLIVGGGLGLTVLEKFFNKNKLGNPTPTQTTQPTPDTPDGDDNAATGSTANN